MDDNSANADSDVAMILAAFDDLVRDGIVVGGCGRGWVMFTGIARDLQISRDWRDGYIDAQFIQHPSDAFPRDAMPVVYLLEASGRRDRSAGWAGYDRQVAARLFEELAAEIKPLAYLLSVDDPALWSAAQTLRSAAAAEAMANFEVAKVERSASQASSEAMRAWREGRWRDVVADYAVVGSLRQLKASEAKRRDIARRRAGGGA